MLILLEYFNHCKPYISHANLHILTHIHNSLSDFVNARLIKPLIDNIMNESTITIRWEKNPDGCKDISVNGNINGNTF